MEKCCQDRLGGYSQHERDQIRLFCNEQEEHRDEVVQMANGDFKGNGQEEGQRQCEEPTMGGTAPIRISNTTKRTCSTSVKTWSASMTCTGRGRRRHPATKPDSPVV